MHVFENEDGSSKKLQENSHVDKNNIAQKKSNKTRSFEKEKIILSRLEKIIEGDLMKKESNHTFSTENSQDEELINEDATVGLNVTENPFSENDEIEDRVDENTPEGLSEAESKSFKNNLNSALLILLVVLHMV